MRSCVKLHFLKLLGHIGLYGILLFSGYFFSHLSSMSAMAQDNGQSVEFSTVVCRSLRIVDSSGNVCAILKKNSGDEGEIQILKPTGVTVCRIGADAQDGTMSVADRDGRIRGVVGSDTFGGKIAVTDNNGVQTASISHTENGNQVVVTGKDGMDRAWMVGTSEGGKVEVLDEKSSPRVTLKAVTDSAFARVWNGSGRPNVNMGVAMQDTSLWRFNFAEKVDSTNLENTVPGAGELSVLNNSGLTRAKIGGFADRGGLLAVYGDNNSGNVLMRVSDKYNTMNLTAGSLSVATTTGNIRVAGIVGNDASGILGAFYPGTSEGAHIGLR